MADTSKEDENVDANTPPDPGQVDDELAEAFESGIQASVNYDRALEEAMAVIANFSKGISTLTQGRVTVAFRPTFIERARQVSNLILSALGPMPPEKVRTHALFARGQLGNAATQEFQLCLVHLADAVFPVELEWPQDVTSCLTPRDLAIGLRTLIKDAQVGKKLRTIMTEYDAMVAKGLGESKK